MQTSSWIQSINPKSLNKVKSKTQPIRDCGDEITDSSIIHVKFMEERRCIQIKIFREY